MTGKEKATAPVLSVGADGKQPLSKSNKKSIAELPPKGNLQATESCPVEPEKMQNKNELQTVSMTELYDTVYPPKIPIVDGLIYAGTYLFVGAPKVGKSFFMAQLGYHVSMGLDLWDYPVRKGTVLYLALEDDYARLQKRLSRMFGMEKLTKAETELWKEPADPILETIAKVVSEEQPLWCGTASELLQLLQDLDIQPNVLTRKLNIGAEQLFVNYGIRYASNREHSGRMIKLELVKG